MSFSVWLLPCFFEGGEAQARLQTQTRRTKERKRQRVERGGRTCCVRGFNVLCLQFQRVAPFPLPSGTRKEASGTASLFFHLISNL